MIEGINPPTAMTGSSRQTWGEFTISWESNSGGLSVSIDATKAARALTFAIKSEAKEKAQAAYRLARLKDRNAKPENVIINASDITQAAKEYAEEYLSAIKKALKNLSNPMFEVGPQIIPRGKGYALTFTLRPDGSSGSLVQKNSQRAENAVKQAFDAAKDQVEMPDFKTWMGSRQKVAQR